MEFYTVVTDAGLQALGDAAANGEAFTIAKAVIGDGNGQKITPTKSMVSLVNQVYECPISSTKRAKKDPNTILFTIAVPANVGGFTMREIGLLDSTGVLFVVGSIPALEKTVEASGSAADTTYVLPLKFKNADDVTIFFDALALATQQDLIDHDEDPDAHKHATEEEHGFTQYATEEEHKAKAARNRACTPFGVWALIKSVMSSAYTSTSTITVATSKAVSSVYTKFTQHTNASDPHGAQSRVDSKMQGHLGVSDPHDVVTKVKALLSSSITNASSTTFATPLAVKTVNDHLSTHKAASDPHGIVAKVKALLNSSITSTSTTTFATPKAVKLVRDLVVGHTGATAVHVPEGGNIGDVLLKSEYGGSWGGFSTGIHGGCIWFDGVVNADGRPIDGKTGQPDLNYGVCDGRTYQAPDGRQVVTVNARDRFLVVAGGKYAVGATGGAEMVTTSINQTAIHEHELLGGLPGTDVGVGGNKRYVSARSYEQSVIPGHISSVGGSQAHENRPPYLGLFLIKRL